MRRRPRCDKHSSQKKPPVFMRAPELVTQAHLSETPGVTRGPVTSFRKQCGDCRCDVDVLPIHAHACAIIPKFPDDVMTLGPPEESGNASVKSLDDRRVYGGEIEGQHTCCGNSGRYVSRPLISPIRHQPTVAGRCR